MITNNNELLTVSEMASTLKVCKETVRRRIRSGEIPEATKDGKSFNGRFLVKSTDFENYLKSLWL